MEAADKGPRDTAWSSQGLRLKRAGWGSWCAVGRLNESQLRLGSGV